MLSYTDGLFCYLCFFSGDVAACIASSGEESGKIRINLPMFVSSIGDLLCPCLSSVATTSASASSPLGTSDEDPASAVKKEYVILPICRIGLVVRPTSWWFTSPSRFLLSGEPGSSFVALGPMFRARLGVASGDVCPNCHLKRGSLRLRKF